MEDVNVIKAAVSLKQCGAGAGGRACRDRRDILDKEKLDAVVVATPEEETLIFDGSDVSLEQE